MTNQQRWSEQLAQSDEVGYKTVARDTVKSRQGDRILMPSAQAIDAYVRAIPEGSSKDTKTMRQDLAAVHGVAMTCPVTTGIQLRVVAEAAYEAFSEGASMDEITPVWRVLDKKSSTIKRLSFDQAFILDQRSRERL